MAPHKIFWILGSTGCFLVYQGLCFQVLSAGALKINFENLDPTGYFPDLILEGK